MSATAVTPPVITVSELRLSASSAPFDLELHAGRVLGLAGLEGHGQQRLLEVLSGQSGAHGGTVKVEGAQRGADRSALKSLHDAFDNGIVYVPRDRKTQGILPSLSVLENFAVATLSEHATCGVLRPGAVRRRYEEFASRLGIVAADSNVPIRALSGGNQQKVLLARWLAASPRVLLLNDPSRGVDHRTRVSLYDIYRQVAAQGTAVVLLSTEIEELLAAADEIVVFREDTVAARLQGDDRSRERILAAMFGGHDE
jgi:ribose transport system ATP-binding protein